MQNINTIGMTEKQANKCAKLAEWGAKMSFARQLLDEAKAKSEAREAAFWNHRKTA